MNFRAILIPIDPRNQERRKSRHKAKCHALVMARDLFFWSRSMNMPMNFSCNLDLPMNFSCNLDLPMNFSCNLDLPMNFSCNLDLPMNFSCNLDLDFLAITTNSTGGGSSK